ncbi:MAG: methionyl-tRNA formyltransferase, partial [Calditrichia bacterium]
VAFRILPEEVYSMPPLGTVNLHPSLLPKYRGAAPINWTIINGEETTGVTTIFIQKEIDAGNIILQEEVQVQPDETAGSLHDRLAEIGAKLLIKTLNQIERGEVKTTRQDESLVSKAPKITREITHLNFDQPASKVKNWIHGLSPVPGAFAKYRGKTIKIFRARVISGEPVENLPGTIVRATGGELWIACKPGIISVLRLQMEGKKVLETAEFLRGYSLDSSERFE